MSRRFQHYEPTGAAVGMYGVMFAHNGQALKLNAGVWSLAPYVKADHPLYAIPMSEDGERTLFWRTIDIADANIVMPANLESEPYILEIWSQLAGTPDRDTDTLLTAYQYQNVAPNYLYTGNVQVGYDSTTNTLRALMFLEQDHEMYLPKSATLKLCLKLDNGTNTVVFTQAVLQAAAGPQKQFELTRPDTILSPDRIYFAEATFVDQLDGVHIAGCGVTVWD